MNENSKYVQYGCGLSAPSTWRNFDASFSLRLQRLVVVGRFFRGGSLPDFPANVEYGDIVKGLPVKTESCEAIYCSHVLEHLALRECHVALGNSFAYLQPGGVFRLVMPDLEAIAREYLAADDEEACHTFLRQASLGREAEGSGLQAFARGWLGKSQHLWMWDFKAMRAALIQAGFRGIRRAEFGDSTQPCFGDVEDPGRWQGCLGIECVK